MSNKQVPAEVLKEARRRDSQSKRTKVLVVLQDLVARGEAVTFAAVAKQAGVSNWLVYAEGVREHIEVARTRQAAQPQKAPTGSAVSSAGLTTDLALARHEIAELRRERDHLKDVVRRQLGQQLDQVGTSELVARIDELTRQNSELTAKADALQRSNTDLQEKLTEAEDDLQATRTSLRRMIRTQPAPPPAST
ncbi:DUF6262 family protein [Streptomyces sp. NPDC002476]|uniref:DUF6262 family protein n=1 Tax=Streptomyces sp. NPDC002476 TaxID=3364648 RepID=UPI0036C505B4